VTAPGAGQGTRFIKGSVRYVRGDATLDFKPEGLRATIAFPLTKPPVDIHAVEVNSETSNVVR
jgi:hypothetical protein